MDTQILEKAEKDYIKNDIPTFEVGDTIAVHTLIREGDKSRTQVFQGIVISKKGSGTRATFTVRKISNGIGVEKIFPLHSTNISKIEFIKKGKVRRSKLYYMRDRIGKSATKITEGKISEEMARQHETLNSDDLQKEEEKNENPQKDNDVKKEVEDKDKNKGKAETEK